MKKNTRLIFFILLFVIQACGDPADNSNSNSPNMSIGLLTDVDVTPNQISEEVVKNNVEVGVTAFAIDPDDPVTYQLLDSADGRFAINESTGTVFLSDYLLLNANLFPTLTITVKATSDDGSSQIQTFNIAVIPPKVARSELSDANDEFNEVLEGINRNLKEIEILANSDNPQYDPSNDEVNRLAIDDTSKGISTFSKNFDINSLNKYENNIPLVSQFNLLLDWNNGSGQELLGWKWLNDVAYGNPGWILSADGPIGGGEKYAWGNGVRSFNKGDYGKKNTALIDTYDYAPSTSSGGSLKVTETRDSKDHRSTWWLWYDGKPLSERGITNKKTDRMDFYLKTEGMNDLEDNGGKESIRNNFHIGTYLCWKTGKSAYGRGDGCPYEGPGNQHYYHYLAINPGAWIHVLLDQHPQHKRGNKKTLKNNPTWDKNKKNYFEQLSQFYIEIRAKQKQKTNFRIDELLFYSTKDSVVPMQNEESISSLWVGYWKEKDVWEIGFHDKSQRRYNDKHNSTFEIRWSTYPITNKNFHKANAIEPMFYGGLKSVGIGGKNLIRRANGWQSNVWTRFKLPDVIEQKYVKVFFAVKDVSIKGKHIGTKWPYNKGDGHNAPTSNIKIIDYHLRPILK